MKKTLLPIHTLIFFLLFLTLWSIAVWNSTESTAWFLSFRNLFLLGIGGFVVRFGIRSLIDPHLNTRYEHRLITVLILFLLFDALTPWWIFLALGIITELAQYFIRTPLGPLCNPAALGTLIVSICGYLPSWWGVNPAPRFPLFGIEISIIAWVTAIGAGYVIHRYKKLSIAWSALIACAIGYFLLFWSNPSYLILEGTLLFFILIMVCEPKTSPVMKKEQLIYGALVGILVPIGLYFHFIEASIIALLIGNLYAGRRFIPGFFASHKPPVPVSAVGPIS